MSMKVYDVFLEQQISVRQNRVWEDGEKGKGVGRVVRLLCTMPIKWTLPCKW